MSCKMSLKGLSAAVAIAAATLSATANAAVISVEQVVSAAFDSAFNPLPAVPDLSSYSDVGTPIVLQVDYHVHVSDMLPGERGFGNVGFSVIPGPGVAEAGAGGWASNTATTDSNGIAPGGIVPLFSTNADAGPSSSDQLGIFATIAGGISNPNASDARTKIGQAGGPTLLGTIYYLWDGATTSAIQVAGTQASSYTTAGTFGPAIADQSLPLLLVAIPEPSTMALGALAVVGMILGRRRSA